MAFAQIIYHSRVRQTGPDGYRQLLLRDILATSQPNNVRDGLTGFLLFDRAVFYQVLEGAREPLLRTYDRILHDPRHTDVVLMALRDVRGPSFPQWSMCGMMRLPEQAHIFVRHGFPAAGIDPARITAPSFLALAMDLQDRQRATPVPAATDAAA